MYKHAIYMVVTFLKSKKMITTKFKSVIIWGMGMEENVAKRNARWKNVPFLNLEITLVFVMLLCKLFIFQKRGSSVTFPNLEIILRIYYTSNQMQIHLLYKHVHYNTVIWIQPKHPTVGDQLNKLWFILTRENCLVIFKWSQSVYTNMERSTIHIFKWRKQST